MAHDTTTTTSSEITPEEVRNAASGPIMIGDRRFIPDTFATSANVWFGDMRWIGLVAVIGTPVGPEGMTLDTRFDMISQGIVPLAQFVEDIRLTSIAENKEEIYTELLQAVDAGVMNQDAVDQIIMERALENWVELRVKPDLRPGQVVCQADHYDISSQVWVTPRDPNAANINRLSNGEAYDGVATSDASADPIKPDAD